MKKTNIKHLLNTSKKQKNIILIVLLFILFLISCTFGYKVYKNYNYNKLESSLIRLNDKGYWYNQDNIKISDKKNNNHNINLYDYYKSIDNTYSKSLKEFIEDFNSNKLEYKFKVNYYLDSNTLYMSQEYKFMEKINFPKDPIKENYIFTNWVIHPKNNEGAPQEFTNSSTVLVDMDINFEASFLDNLPPVIENNNTVFIEDSNI
ncbi:MAG: hypothetical protein ACTTID_03285 [Bacillales bacterium]